MVFGFFQVIPVHEYDKSAGNGGAGGFRKAAAVEKGQQREHKAGQHRNSHAGIQNQHQEHSGNDDGHEKPGLIGQYHAAEGCQALAALKMQENREAVAHNGADAGQHTGDHQLGEQPRRYPESASGAQRE